VVLPRLNKVEVGSFAFREAVLAVKLELSGDNWVLTPAVQVEGGLSEDEGASIGNTGVGESATSGASEVGRAVITSVGRVIGGPPGGQVSTSSSASNGTLGIHGTSIIEHARSIDEGGGCGSDGIVASEGVDSVGKSIEGVSVVEGLSAEQSAQEVGAFERRAVVNVLVRLNDPDKLLNGVVKVELDLVGRRTNGLITSELELFDQVLVGVLSHTSALISVQEHVVDVQRSSNEGLVVSGSNLLGASTVLEGRHSPQAFVDGTDVEVDLNFVVLKGNKRESQTRVTAEPELERNIESGLRESVARSANLAGSAGIAGAINVIEGGISDEGQLSGVADHLVVSTLLLRGHGKLVPDVHPVTELAVNALTTDLNLNLRDELLTGEVEPAGINATGTLHGLVDLRESNLKVSAVSKITVAGDSAGNTATEVSLAVESLLNRLHCEVSVTLVGNLPESDLGLSSQVNVLCAVGDKLHKSSTHFVSLLYYSPRKKIQDFT